jgi:hypothetical protein
MKSNNSVLMSESNASLMFKPVMFLIGLMSLLTLLSLIQF